MIGGMIEITFDLVVRSPLHVGDGDTGRSTDLLGKAEIHGMSGEPVEIATVCAAASDLAVLPGSTLKGAARGLMSGHPLEGDLFGPAKIRDPQEAAAGLLVFWTAKLRDGSWPDLAGAPNADTALARRGPEVAGSNRTHGSVGLFVEARTSVDLAWGIADDGRLFHQQFVAPGARFRAAMALHLRDGRDEADDVAALAELLARMRAGLRLGSGETVDQGRVELDLETLVAERTVVAGTGGLEKSVLTKSLSGSVIAVRTDPVGDALVRHLALTGDGPFLVNDSAAGRRRDQAARGGAETDLPHLGCLRQIDQGDLPRLPGSSLMGALRSRALWLGQMQPIRIDDEPDRIADPTDIAALTIIERLFGVNGWRGLIRLQDISCTGHAGWHDLTSVKLDRFSGAPIDNALFTTRTSVDPQFRVELYIEKRGPWPSAGDLDFALALIVDLDRHGLKLGHGTNRGYGWFEVRTEEAT